MQGCKKTVKTVGLFLLLTLMIQMLLPCTAFAEAHDQTVVRVGWHEPPYSIKDESGKHSGYSYEYQRKVAAYTG